MTSSSYADDIQFAGLVEAATAAADAHQRDLGKRKRGEINAYTTVSNDATAAFPEPLKNATLSNSAAVLFREPSEKSKKYSRPPLGKVFTSLELAPDSFLKLQTAAKDYMLSEEFPERKDVVGHKKQNGNNDHAKLKLYQCVDDFLQLDNNGENFFGHSADTADPNGPPRSFFWPEDRGRIVKLLMPLLRKMVTNERQRIYAAETRKSEPKTSIIEGGPSPDMENDINVSIQSTMIPEIDPSLQVGFKHGNSAADATTSSVEHDVSLSPNSGTISLHVHVITQENGNTKSVVPEFVLPLDDAGTFTQFVDGLKKNIDAVKDSLEIKALLPQGLTPIKGENDWILSQMAVVSSVWMSILQIVVEV